jgi:hypothetical protein
MAGPFTPGAAGLVPITGPNGTWQIPQQFAPAFGLQGVPAPTEPLPTFAPEELTPPAPPPPAPAPAPQPFALTEEENAALPAPPQPARPQQPAAPPLPAPGSLTAQLANVEHQKDIALRQGAVDADVADQEAAALRASAEEEKRLTAERDAERARQQKEIAAARAKQADALDAFVNHKVDQNRAWHNKSTGQKVLAGIGIALAGIGGALVARDTGRPVTNPALDMIMGAIQDDVRLQMADRDKLGQIVGMKRQAVDDLRAQYTDSEAAYNAIVSGRARQVANQMAAIGASAKSERAKLGAEAAVTQLTEQANMFAQTAQAKEDAARQQAIENRRAQSQLGLGWANYERGKFESDRAFGEGTRRWDAEFGQRQKEFDAQISAAEKKGDPALAKELREQKREEEKRSIPGLFVTVEDGKQAPLVAKTEEEAKKLRNQKAAADKILALLDENMRLMDKNGGESSTLKSDVWQKMKSNEAAILNGLRTLEQMGTLDASALEVGKQQLGGVDPSSFVRNARAGYGQFRKQVLGGLNSAALAQDERAALYDVPEATEKGVLGDAIQDPTYQAAFKRDDTRVGLAATGDALLRVTGGGPASEKARVAAGIDPTQQKALDLWIAAYSDPWAPPAKRAQAEKFIKGWTMGNDPAVAAYAKARAKELGIATVE